MKNKLSTAMHLLSLSTFIAITIGTAKIYFGHFTLETPQLLVPASV